MIVSYINLELVLPLIAEPLMRLESLLNYRIDIISYVKPVLIFMIAATIIRVCFRHYRHKYRITQDGVAHIIGILGREERPLRYKKMTLATKKQTFFEYLFNLGTIFLFSSGTDRADVVLTGVPSPKKLLDRIQASIDEAPSA